MADPRHDLGQRGERLAEDLLVREGAVVLARNFRTRGGELDLVVEQDGDLVGVEVKTRRPGQPALPEEAVNGVRLARLETALTQFAQRNGHEDASWRIDVVAIEVDPDGTVRRLEHIRDAFDG